MFVVEVRILWILTAVTLSVVINKGLLFKSNCSGLINTSFCCFTETFVTTVRINGPSDLQN